MATIALSAVGMAVGGSIGGTVLGLSAATIGRAAGAAIGRRIDQQILGGGSETVETGRIDRFRVTGAAEGADIQRIYGRMRVPGQVIWASQFQESSTTTGGGKGGPSTPKTTTYAYSVSLAIALCEGEISRIGRVWADGEEVSPETLNMRLYPGTLDQQPDPKIAAVEGAENTPAYRGTAYVVLEDLALAPFGNRIPQLTFEVVRGAPAALDPLTGQITGITLMPGTGEYALATTQVHLNKGYGASIPLNTNTPLGPSDFAVSMDALAGDLPAAQSVVFPVAWFGDDLRCNSCQIAPMVEQQGAEVSAMPWRVSGITRGQADVVPSVDDLPLYGGTPTDAAVVEAIADLSARGKDVVFSPLLLMTQVAGNSLPDPWTGEAGQDQTPWRGRITTALAPGWPSSTDGTATAATEVAAFLGAADSSDFSVSGTTVSHTGPADIGYRRFILHYAHLCAAAGGVSAFCIGSQLSGLTSIRDDQDGFPMVDGLIQLAADVRGILGPDCKISYAADWTEFHGMTPVGTDDKLFHLDALWADPNIDFIG
ncbi:MAG: glycoside hydrolase TIM-barrel-like domain-containing protein, partial [Pseudomonadota bacterium]